MRRGGQDERGKHRPVQRLGYWGNSYVPSWSVLLPCALRSFAIVGIIRTKTAARRASAWGLAIAVIAALLGALYRMGAAKATDFGVLYRKLFWQIAANGSCCDLMLRKCGKSRCYDVLCRARAA